ncbi:hypothetical protein NHX12_007648 [Muraenolepis orangiensis]|uniref:RING-type domain-containing protein n=1 Tax=Muraenolepis orangiensis TaxID=630683 RepID=A0A9Q0DQB0_9TELE|nr:hypothetical protein NHX12_007648 [Muraenolepis orangiensis]
MDGANISNNSMFCKCCGDTYALPAGPKRDNVPYALLCGHVFCGGCLRSMEADHTVLCPMCQVKSSLPEGGVSGLQEDGRIIGLIYIASINQMRRKSRSRTGFPLPTHKAEPADDNAARDDGETADGITVANYAVPTDTAETADDVEPTANTKPTTGYGQYSDNLMEESMRPPKDDVMDHTARDGEGLKEQGHVAPPEQLLELLEEALAQGAESMVHLEHIHQTLVLGQSVMAQRDKERIRAEINQSVVKATQLLHNRQEALLGELEAVEVPLPSQAQVLRVQERIEKVDTAIRKARQVLLPPSLENYCDLHEVLETLQAPVIFELSCVTMGSGLSCVLQSDSLSDFLISSLKLHSGSPKPLPEEQAARHPPRSNPTSPRKWRGTPRAEKEVPGVAPVNKEVLAPPPTGPELANYKQWARKKKSTIAIAPLNQGLDCPSVSDASSFHLVKVTYVLNPNHFYVRYMAENKEVARLSQKTTKLSSLPSSCFNPNDMLETGAQVLVNETVRLWSRGTVVHLSQIGQNDVTSCPAHLLTRARIFMPDNGVTKRIILDREPLEGMDKMRLLMSHLRKLDETMKLELSAWAPLATRCSLKDLVPTDLRKGWSAEVQQELRRVVNSVVVEMELFSKEKGVLLVDLRKPPMDHASTFPVSVTDFYSPLTNSRKQLLFYPPVHPGSQSEHSAMVTHINTLQDFYIQLVGNMESELLHSKLQMCYGSVLVEGGTRGLHLYCPYPLQACVARPASYKVVYVNDLRRIKDEFFALPAMAIQCSLADVVPADGVTWSQACSDRFSALVLRKVVSILAIGELGSKPLEVQMLEVGLQGPQVDMASLLASEHLACYRDGRADPQSDGEPAVWDPPFNCEEPPVGQDTKLQLPAVLENVRVKVTHVTSPGSFYVQLVQNEALLKRVRECAENSELQDVVWKENMFCCALVNGAWERAQILAIGSSNNIAEVQRCDFGSSAKLHPSRGSYLDGHGI